MALTAKQEAFCQHYAANRQGGAAYRFCYSVSPSAKQATCDNRAHELLRQREISARIETIIAEMTAAAARGRGPGGKAAPAFSAVEALKTWLDIATASPDELIGLRVGCCRYCHGEGNQYQWIDGEYMDAVRAYEVEVSLDNRLARLPDIAGGFGFNHTVEPNPDCPRCRGEGRERVVARDTSKLSPGARLLYGGVKQTRNGVEILIADRTRALENATRIIGAFKDNVRLDGSISGMVAAVHLATTSNDVAEVSRVYQEIMRGIAANP